MSAWNYLKAAFFQRVPLPLLGQVRLNVAALAGFGVAGFDQPVFWAVGAGWEALWLTATAGRVSYRQRIDAAHRQVAWRTLEERRLQLYNQLQPAEQQRHHNLRTACQPLITQRPAGQEPEPAAELFTWLHLKLLLARHRAAAGLPTGPDPDVPRLHAGAAVDITDPASSRLAGEAVSLLDSRIGLREPGAPLLPRIDAALLRIENALSQLSGNASQPWPAFITVARDATSAASLSADPPEVQEVERMLTDLQ